MLQRMIAGVLAGCIALTPAAHQIINHKNKTEFQVDDKYHIVNIKKDGTIQEKDTQNDYASSIASYEAYKNKLDNAAIYYNDHYIKMEYGVVSFKRNEQCGYNVEYTNADNDDGGYTNGCYGGDGAYIDTQDDATSITFRLSNVNGIGDIADIKLIPYTSSLQISSYEVKNGELYHNIKTNMDSDKYANRLELGEAPAYLKEGTLYYSYDGQYFYEKADFKKMIDDYRGAKFIHAVNEDEPYYNYFLYLPHRSSTSYSSSELKKYLEQTLGIDQGIYSYQDLDQNGLHDILNQSLFHNNETAFLAYQNIYGANALMMLALASNESAYGRSSISYNKNNLFGHAAYDSSAEESASRYLDAAQSIRSHAIHYISQSYSNPEKFMYHGSFFGNKQSGMNVSYASDPYWGEKAAQYMWRVDKALGGKDKNQYALGIKTNFNPVNIYKKRAKSSDVLYTIEGMGDVSFLLLGKEVVDDTVWYKVQCDPIVSTIDDEYYRYDDNIGYVLADDLQVILNKEALNQTKTYESITFDANGGTFDGDKKLLTMDVLKGSIPSCIAPKRDGYLFNGWTSKIKKADKSAVYHADWRKVNKVSWNKKIKTTYYVGDKLDVSDGEFHVELADGTSKTLHVTPAMVSDYNLNEASKQTWKFYVAGKYKTLKVEVKENKAQEELMNMASELAQLYKDSSKLTGKDKKLIKEFQKKMKKQTSLPYFDWNQIRILDRIIKDTSDTTQVEVLTKYDNTKVSGVRLAAGLSDTNDLKIEIQSEVSGDVKERLHQIATANNWKTKGYISVELKRDDKEIDTYESSIIVSYPKPKDVKDDDLFQVMMEKDGNVMLVETMQTKDSIKFKASQNGCYVLAYKTDQQVNNQSDVLENDAPQIEANFPYHYLLLVLIPVFLIITLMLRKRQQKIERIKKAKGKRKQKQNI